MFKAIKALYFHEIKVINNIWLQQWFKKVPFIIEDDWTDLSGTTKYSRAVLISYSPRYSIRYREYGKDWLKKLKAKRKWNCSPCQLGTFQWFCGLQVRNSFSYFYTLPRLCVAGKSKYILRRHKKWLIFDAN